MIKTLLRFRVPLILLILSFTLSFVYGENSVVNKPETAVIEFIETTDLHGAFFPYDVLKNSKADTSLAQIYTYVKQERAKKEKNVVLLDGGDNLQGQPTVYYYNFEGDAAKGRHIVSDIFNFMNYDAVEIGNHDIEAGHAVYDKLGKELNMPWLAANVIKKSDKTPYFKPYTIITKQGIKIAVLGLVEPQIPNQLPENLWSGIEFEDMISCASKWIKIIKETEKPDMIIGLFHSGGDFTFGGQKADTLNNENAGILVSTKIDGFDAVFLGHDHAGWNKIITNDAGKEVLILGAVNSAKTAAVAEFTLNFESNQLKSKAVKSSILDVKTLPADQEFVDRFAPQLEKVKAYVGKEIGEFTADTTSRDAMFGDSSFVDIVHNIQLELTGADVSFAAPLFFDMTIPKGKIYVRDMFKLYQYENLLFTMKLSGKEIKDFLEFSYDIWFNTMQSTNDHIIHFQTNATGNLIQDARTGSYQTFTPSYNYDSAAGINYTVDVTKPYGSKVTIISFSDGRPFELNKVYKVAINSYRGSGGGNHLIKGSGIAKPDLAERRISSTDIDLRYYLQKYIEKKKVIDPKVIGNWKVIPEDDASAGKDKDFKLLYPN